MTTHYPINFHFELSFNGEAIAFKEVSGISEDIEIEEVISGGENRFKYRLPGTISSKNLVLKRAIVPKNSILTQWCSDTLDEGIVKPIQPKDISVALLNAEGTLLKKWVFYRAYPAKYTIAELKSQENDILIESIEFAYTHFETKS